jgi:hypothetical protein
LHDGRGRGIFSAREGDTMATVFIHKAMLLDGFISKPDSVLKGAE